MAIVVHTLRRSDYRGLTTLGEWVGSKGKALAYTLEDVVRAWGIKDKARTAIPATTGEALYKLGITYSQRFQRKMVIIFTEPDGFTLKANGISFAGIRAHGGNSHLNSSGCIICGKQRIPAPELLSLANRSKGDLVANWFVRDSAEDIITAAVEADIQAGFTPMLRVVNLAQKE